MAVDILSKRVAEVADIPLKNPDGSPMVDDETGEAVSATMFSPGSKVWEVATAARKRKAIRRTRQNGGNYEAALDNETEDTIEFLCAIIKRFNNLSITSDDTSDDTSDKGIVRSVLSEPLLGFVRDHLNEAAGNWENFTQASQPAQPFTSGKSPG